MRLDDPPPTSNPIHLRPGLLAATAERQHGLLTSADLAHLGVGTTTIASWVASGRLAHAAHGVFRVGGCPPTLEGSILAAILVHGHDTWASHRTAAWLWGLEGFGRPGRIELTRLTPSSNQRAAARVHRTTDVPEHHRTQVGAIPVTTLARTLFDLAGRLGALPLSRAIEAGLRTRSCTIGGLYRVTEELGGRGRPGTRAMREALAERGRGYVPTESELDLLGRAVLAPVPGIAWQVPLGDERGYIRRVDGLHRRGRLVVEWDGAEFHDAPDRQALDAAGDVRLAALGFEVVRYRWAQVTADPGSVRRDVAQRIAARAPSHRSAA